MAQLDLRFRIGMAKSLSQFARSVIKQLFGARASNIGDANHRVALTAEVRAPLPPTPMSLTFASSLPQPSFEQPTSERLVIENVTIQRQLLDGQCGTEICIPFLITLEHRSSKLRGVCAVGRTAASLMHQTAIA